MKRYNIVFLISLFLVAFVFQGCYDEEVEKVISPDDYPTITIISDKDGSDVREGDTIVYSISMDKMRTYSTSVEVKVIEDEDHIIEFKNVLIPPYTTEAELVVSYVDDGMPTNKISKIKYEVGCFGEGSKYLVNSKSTIISEEFEVKNLNDTSGLTVYTEWDNEVDDWDLMVIDEAVTGEFTGWAGATGDNPEETLLTNQVKDGVYYIELDPYDIKNDIVSFKILIGKPDHTSESFDFVFDAKELDYYPKGKGIRVIKIVKEGKVFTCTKV